jgi:hypothetical protein
MNNTFNEPDRKAPRFRPKRVNILNKELYNKFIVKYPEYKYVDLSLFKDIVKTFNEKLTDGVIDNRDGVELPIGLGFLFMGTCKPTKNQNTDMAKAIKYGIKTNHKNWETDNKLLKIFYTNYNSSYPFPNKHVWAFKGVRQFRKKASDTYKENYTKYIEVDPARKISNLFIKSPKVKQYREIGNHIPEDYNEFKM